MSNDGVSELIKRISMLSLIGLMAISTLDASTDSQAPQATESSWGTSASTIPLTDYDEPDGALQQLLKNEITVATRVLEQMSSAQEIVDDGYLEDLTTTLNSYEALPEPQRYTQTTVENLMIALRAARESLLSRAPDTRTWVAWARAMDPDSTLHVPKRFWREARSAEVHLDVDDLEAEVFLATKDGLGFA